MRLSPSSPPYHRLSKSSNGSRTRSVCFVRLARFRLFPFVSVCFRPFPIRSCIQSRSTAYRLMAEREILVKAQKELAARSSLKDTLG